MRNDVAECVVIITTLSARFIKVLLIWQKAHRKMEYGITNDNLFERSRHGAIYILSSNPGSLMFSDFVGNLLL